MRRPSLPYWPLITLSTVMAVSCVITTEKGAQDTSNGGSGSATGSGNGSGSGSGSGSSDDGGGGTPAWAEMNIDCEVSLDDTLWDSGTCQAETALSCGESVLATNANGPSQLDGGAYASFWACAVVGTENYSGNEQHFFFEHPGTGYVRIGLDSPCEDLDLFVVRWDGGSCLHPGLSIVECEGQVSSGGGWLYVWNNNPAGYVIVVDGPNGENGPYGVTLNCDDYDPYAQ
jgi:hypothetical protein